MESIIRAKVPAEPTAMGVYAAILDKLGKRPGRTEVLSSVNARLFKGLESLGIDIVVLEDVSQIAVRGSKYHLLSSWNRLTVSAEVLQRASMIVSRGVV